ncbi:stage II sporulation protein D [Fredinandcohnia sp. QZ13]|uniref:stage II sporulation protein D n=1 Tax=Fredinandcohnia sp. QZ13 TaxID=3073144 RepID=UPI0028533D8E|nr:stage II sporulation protein D [Fredinandcohnia sp. QZ13]MDR4890190.1 stage II sporulation protein D [Fredinandcohnia sp. QZ13]
MKQIKPIVVLVSVLFVLILLIPSMLVIPFSGKEAVKLAEERQSNPEPPQIASGPTVEVAVHRVSAQKIENVPLEDYVVGVLAKEMPAKFELEALKAQALAARTYVVRHMLSEEKIGVPDGADVSDTTNHQVYKSIEELKAEWKGDYDWKIKKITQAVKETQGQILTYDGAPIDAQFFSTSNGYTENSQDYYKNEYPYLKSVESPWDVNTEKFHDQVQISVADFEQKLGIKLGSGNDVGKVTARTQSNRVATVEIGGKSFTGREVRETLGLRSTDFSWERKGNNIVIKTKGYGHGVGMSQYGADGMAKDGKSYKEIVSHYYQGVEISSTENFLNKLTVKK